MKRTTRVRPRSVPSAVRLLQPMIFSHAITYMYANIHTHVHVYIVCMYMYMYIVHVHTCITVDWDSFASKIFHFSHSLNFIARFEALVTKIGIS